MEAMEDMPGAERRRLSHPPPPSEVGFFDQLPDSMVEEILLRLPLSSAFGSRCVSKLCLSLTSSPHFIQRFRRRYAASNENPPLGLLLQGSYDITTREFSVCSGEPEINFSGFSLSFLPGFRLNGNDPITVMASCEDLLCCNRERFQSDYFVVNPITRQWVALPPTLSLHEYVLTGFVCDPASVPEARKGGRLRYRIVRIPVSRDSQTELNLEIFSSEDGQWNEFAMPIAEAPRTFLWTPRAAVACNGILYWQLRRGGVKVMRFDPFNSMKKEIHIIQDPPQSFNQGSQKYKLGICQGKLRMSQVTWYDRQNPEPSHVMIWELEEGHPRAEWRVAKEVWLQEIVVSGESSDYAKLRNAVIGFGYDSMWPLAFHPSDEDTIYFGCKNKIICYDLKMVSVEIVGEYHLEKTMGGRVDSFPFQQPWWPTPVPALPKL